MSVLSCPHCGSSLTALDVETAPLRCPVCGAMLNAPAADEALPIREAIVREEDDSATRAVPKERFAPIVAQAAADHAAAAPVATTRDDATQALPVSPELAQPSTTDARDATQELPPAAWSLEPPARRSLAGALRAISIALVSLVLLGIIVVAVLVANGVIGAGSPLVAQPTATRGASTATATPVGVIFGAPGLYRVTHQQGWTITQRNSPPQTYYALLTAPSGGSSVNIEAMQASSAPDPATLDGQFLRALAQQGTSPSLAGAPASVTVGGQEWTQITADVALRVASGQPQLYAHAVVMSTRHGSYVYTIVCLTPATDAAAAAAAFTTANAAYFQPMLASFTFLS